jgi:hypothetical protein
VADLYFAFEEMDQIEDDVITTCGARFVLREEKKILGSSVMESNR